VEYPWVSPWRMRNTSARSFLRARGGGDLLGAVVLRHRLLHAVPDPLVQRWKRVGDGLGVAGLGTGAGTGGFVVVGRSGGVVTCLAFEVERQVHGASSRSLGNDGRGVLKDGGHVGDAPMTFRLVGCCPACENGHPGRESRCARCTGPSLRAASSSMDHPDPGPLSRDVTSQRAFGFKASAVDRQELLVDHALVVEDGPTHLGFGPVIGSRSGSCK
jgi:hypothetical protein